MDATADPDRRPSTAPATPDRERPTGRAEDDRAPPSSGRRGPRAVLALGVALGAVYLARAALVRPGAFGLDFRVYYHAAAAALAAAPIYGVAHGPHPTFTYLYPPATLLGFAPLLALPELAAYLVHVVGQLALAAGAARLIVRYLDGAGAALARIDRALIYAYALASVHAVPSLVYGQVNLAVTAGLVAGFAALETGRERAAGVAFGLAAFLKLFPALVGLWLLRRRAWGAIGAAVATGAVGFAVGLAAFGPGATEAYAVEAVLGRATRSAFAGGLPPGASYLTLLRPASVLLPSLGPAAWTALAAAALAPVVAAAYRATATRRDRLVGAYVTLAGTLLVLPSYPIYAVVLLFPQVPLLYLLDGRPGRFFLAGTALLGATVRLDDVRRHLLPAFPDAVAGPAAAVLEPLLTLASPQLIGILATLVGCLTYATGRGRDGPPEPERGGAARNA